MSIPYFKVDYKKCDELDLREELYLLYTIFLLLLCSKLVK
jgi:hypothetical protein